MDNLTLRKVQSAQLDMVLEIDRLCKTNGISYVCIAGTALGAVRHKGFIPWDDDLDIGLLREDYDKLKTICMTELNNSYVYQDYFTDKKYGSAFAKIRIKNTTYLEKNTIMSKANNGIYIDIFPFDNVDIKKERLRANLFYLYKRIALAKTDYLPTEKSIIKYICYKFLKYAVPISLEKTKNIMEKIVRYDCPSEFVVAYSGSYGYWREKVKREWLIETIDFDFEGYRLPIPRFYNEYLTSIYGDYMTLPPKEKRNNRHKIELVDFGDYRVKNTLL